MSGEWQSQNNVEGNEMKKGTTVWSMVLCAGVLLATLTSVYAAHFAAGSGRYSATSEPITESETIAQFQFHVAARPSQRSPSIPVTTVKVQVNVAHESDSTSFELSTVSTAIDPPTIETDEGIDIVTIKGELLSTLVLGEGPDRERFTESASFEAVAVDRATPGAGSDTFSLTVFYNASGDQGQRFEDLGFTTCDPTTMICAVTFAGTLETGEIQAHSAGGG